MERVHLVIPALLLHLGTVAQSWETLPDVPIELAFPVVVEFEGTIHVIGGGAPAGAYDIHLRYTPATNQWDTLAPVPYRAQQPCGAVVGGKIHFCGGGYPNSGTPLDDHYYYDGTLDQWFPAAPLPFPTVINEAAEMDGKLYVLSGQPNRTLCQYYDPATDEWTPANPLPDMDFWYGAIISARGTIYRFGGGGYISPTSNSHVYDASNDDWPGLPDMPGALHAPAGANLGDSLLCIAGGYFNAATDAVWLYDIDAQTFSPSALLPSARSYHSLVVAGGCLYCVGGDGGDPSIGVSLLRNCSPSILTGVPEAYPRGTVPFSTLYTPTGLDIQFKGSVASQPIWIDVSDATGKSIRSEGVSTSMGTRHVSADHLANGLYTVAVHIGSARYLIKWMVQR
ncbi:MAG: kelch repeat-containing protein [Flavobacteriales bacterium]